MKTLKSNQIYMIKKSLFFPLFQSIESINTQNLETAELAKNDEINILAIKFEK